MGDKELVIGVDELDRIAVECSSCRTVVTYPASLEQRVPDAGARCPGCGAGLDLVAVLDAYRAFFKLAAGLHRAKIRFQVPVDRPTLR